MVRLYHRLQPASLLYRGPRGVEALWLFGVGVSFRAMGRPVLLV
jgi:hypothetical protein